MDILEDLKYRGLINQATNLEGLKTRLKKGKIVLYGGFDPTAESIHVGNLLVVLTLKRFQLAGHQPIALVGGATGLIGDPSGRSKERLLNPEPAVKKWDAKIRKQLENLLDFSDKNNPAILVDNYHWHNKIKTLDFLREVGKNFTVPYLLAKEAIKSRLDKGISFTEFSYALLQAFDFSFLLKKYNCQLQIGGADQWGNITAGADLIKKTADQEVFGLTLPLVTTTKGAKFGKTAGNAVWLDPKLTTPYQFYQFWAQTDDSDVMTFLKYFTFLSHEAIEKLGAKIKQEPENKSAQTILAFEVTKLVHGEKAAKQAEKISQALFYGKISNLSPQDLKIAFQDVPSSVLKGISQISLADLLVKTRVSFSKRQAREDIQNKIININGRIFDAVNQIISPSLCLYNSYLIIKKGKKNYHLVFWKKH